MTQKAGKGVFEMNENTKVVQEAYAKFTSGDIEGLLELFSEDIHWKIPEINGSPFTSEVLGRDKVRDFFGVLSEAEEFTNFQPREYITENNRVVVLGHSAGKIISTGRNFETDWTHIFTVREGKITSFLEFFDTAVMERAYQRTATA